MKVNCFSLHRSSKSKLTACVSKPFLGNKPTITIVFALDFLRISPPIALTASAIFNGVSGGLLVKLFVPHNTIAVFTFCGMPPLFILQRIFSVQSPPKPRLRMFLKYLVAISRCFDCKR